MSTTEKRMPMTTIPPERLPRDDFVAACRDTPDHLVYFLLNVGDGDTQVILLPCDTQGPHQGKRRLIVVDAATVGKLPALIESLAEARILEERPDLVPIVIATHPHDDHISGLPQLLDWLGDYVGEYWDPGYYHPTGAYVETMRALEARSSSIQYTQPTSGMTRYIRPQILGLSDWPNVQPRSSSTIREASKSPGMSDIPDPGDESRDFQSALAL